MTTRDGKKTERPTRDREKPKPPNVYAPEWLVGTPLADVWWTAYIDTGSGTLAIEAVRNDSAYDEIFEGNRRDDGSLRYDEGTYFGILESFADSLLSIDLNPDLFRSKFPGMIAGLVSPNEFASRVNNVYERVLTSTEQIRNYYAAEFSFDMTDQAIVASFLDSDIGDAILNRRIAISEVGGSAAARNFNPSIGLVEELVSYGLDTQDEAQQFFSVAEDVIPSIQVLARRHADPDDTFDLEDFTNAQLFGDPEQRRRMRRLMAQERTSFSSDRSLTVIGGDRGRLTGLQER